MHLLKFYLLQALAMALARMPTLAAHGFGNRGDRMTYVEQMSDSINITGRLPLDAPYHATAREDFAMSRWHPEFCRT